MTTSRLTESFTNALLDDQDPSRPPTPLEASLAELSRRLEDDNDARIVRLAKDELHRLGSNLIRGAHTTELLRQKLNTEFDHRDGRKTEEDLSLVEQVADLEHRLQDVATLSEAVQHHLRQTNALLGLCRMILLKQDGKDHP